jgi:DNA-binding NarL/FixJ family response regulator
MGCAGVAFFPDWQHDGERGPTSFHPQRERVMTKRIRILLADDQPLSRTSVAFLLSTHSDMEVVGEAGDGQEAVDLARSQQPDVVVMDYAMPVMNGVDATSQIKTACPRSRIIGHSQYDSDTVMDAMIQAGAVAFVPKRVSLSPLIDAIRESVSPSA